MRQRIIGSDNDADTNNAYDVSLVAATSSLETIIRTTFNRVQVKDTWFVDWTQRPQRHDRIQLFLSHGFLDPDEDVELRVYWDIDELSDQEPEDEKVFRLQAEPGLLIVLASGQVGSFFTRYATGNVIFRRGGYSANVLPVLGDQVYFELTYTSGFRTKNDPDGGSKLFRNVPEWLEEGAVNFARELFQKDVDVLDKDVDAAKSMLSNTRGVQLLRTMAETMMQPHIRYYPNWLPPFLSEETSV